MRMTISIPDDLHKRMNRVDGVVWSHIAAAAFEAKLAEIAEARKVASMKDVIERLKAAEHADHAEAHSAGREAGKQWAMEDARPSELRRLNENRHEEPAGELNAPLCWTGWVFALANGDLDARDANELAEHYTNGLELDEDGEKAWAAGFIAGAMEVWDAVKSQI